MDKQTNASSIPASRVNGTAVYNTAGERLGDIDDVMIEKQTGQVVYAVMSFGGFLGIGDKHWPLPWSALNYDTSKEGFVVDLDKKKLENAPSYDEDDFRWTPDYGRSVDRYYGAPSYWS